MKSLADLLPVLLLVHAGATWLMVGLIWFVQLVHYPLMGIIGGCPTATWQAFALAHQRRTTWIVAPTMFVEAGCVLALIVVSFGAFQSHDVPSRSLSLAGLALLGVAWATTFFAHVPLHARLGRRFDARDHARLVSLNWIRTSAWSARGLLALALLA
jgi:hypothetical protein